MKKSYWWVLGLVMLSFVTVGIFLTAAPDQIPVHYNMHGEIDRWGSKFEFLIFPLISVVSGAVMWLAALSVRRKGEEWNEKVVNGMNVWMQVLFNAIWIFFMYQALKGANLSELNSGLSIKAIYLILLGSLIPLGNKMPKVSRNGYFGLRTKWSMADDVCWQKSQRFGGYLLVGTGLAAIPVVSLAPAAWSGYLVFGFLVLSAVMAVIGTYGIYRKEHI